MPEADVAQNNGGGADAWAWIEDASRLGAYWYTTLNPDSPAIVDYPGGPAPIGSKAPSANLTAILSSPVTLAFGVIVAVLVLYLAFRK